MSFVSGLNLLSSRFIDFSRVRSSCSASRTINSAGPDRSSRRPFLRRARGSSRRHFLEQVRLSFPSPDQKISSPQLVRIVGRQMPRGLLSVASTILSNRRPLARLGESLRQSSRNLLPARRPCAATATRRKRQASSAAWPHPAARLISFAQLPQALFLLRDSAASLRMPATDRPARLFAPAAATSTHFAPLVERRQSSRSAKSAQLRSKAGSSFTSSFGGTRRRQLSQELDVVEHDSSTLSWSMTGRSASSIVFAMRQRAPHHHETDAPPPRLRPQSTTAFGHDLRPRRCAVRCDKSSSAATHASSIVVRAKPSSTAVAGSASSASQA